ncbi:MAG: sialidase family protein, partial [Bacteroidales bacterium]|nr:sialidase family protein [Bacteroidales bacterium]MDY2710505.1 sialidase family protein [Sodaliphilus sp.]
MSYFKKLKKSTGRTRFLLALLTLLFGFSANAATYKVSDTPADLANLENGAKVVMYNIGAEKLVGYNNGEVSKKEIAVTDDDRAAYVFTVKKSGSTVALVNSTSYGPQASYSSKNSKFSFKWSTAPNYFAVYSGSNYTQLYVTGARNNGYLAFSNSKMTVTTSGNYETSKWNFYEVTQETSGSTGDGAQTVHKQLKAWQTDAGYQEVGYIGLGNKNQVLAMACVSVSADDVPTLTYRLFGHTGYLSAISVYARMRDKGQDYFPDGSYAKYENTFAHIFDYRNPEKNCGALFLGTTHEVPAAGEVTTFTSNLKLPAGEYVIYLVANVRSAEEIGGLKNLPLIGGAKRNYTRVGGVIDKVSNKTIYTVNNYSGEGGGRVLVPNFKLLYAPRYENFATSEEYSRYYRIPAITRASDGTLVALSDARKMHIHDVTNSIDVVSRRSSDNGKTWSDYVVIFQGSQSGEDCYNWAGYGDAAVASFSNGTVIATAIHGFGLSGTRNDPATDVVWKVSRDNGKSWSSEYKMDQSLFGGLRGNISPGNICVANDGYLKGKALVGLRTSKSPNKSPNNNSGSSASHQRIYCLTYDPDENEWTQVKISVQVPTLYGGTETKTYDYLENTSNYLDEVQFVQVAKDQYILSARSNASGNRLFYRLTFTSATEATATMISQSGMNLANPCNGDLIKYAAKGGTYILHTVPKDMVYGSNNCRTSLSAYYTKLSTSGNLKWTRSLNLFDPFDNTDGGAAKTGIGAMDEAAQYSSLSMQEDGTIAVLMEAYPYAIRHKDQASSTYERHWGDWVMGQYYINLRIGDIVDGAEQPDPVKIDAPVISPNSSTYDSYETADIHRPTITISHQNYVNYPDIYDVETAKVNTLYDFEFFNAEGVLQKQVNLNSFQTESASFTWKEVYEAMGYTDDPAYQKKGWYLRVSAYCVSEANSAVVSNKDVKIYTFANPVRNIKVIGLPTSGASKTELSTQGNTVGSDVWLTVGVGQEVRINAPALYPFTFKGFYYKYKMNGSTNEQVKLSQKLPDNYNEVSGMQHQITFTVPSVAALADNHKDGDVAGLVIYAVYEVEAGFSTRVNTQYNNGLVGGKYESHHSYWTPNTDTEHVERIQGAVGGTPLAKNLVIPAAANQNNTHIGGTGNADKGGLTYPKALNYGLDAYVTLVPDSRAAKYLNAIIRVKKDDAYLQNYYVVNGANQALYGNITSAFNGCLGVVNWYAYSDGEFYPKAVGMKSYEVGSKPKATSARRSIVEGGTNGAWYKVDSDISFAGICEKAETFDGVVTVEIYLVNGDVTSVNELSNSNYYITK